MKLSILPILDFLFPPLCLVCKERCSTKFFCPDCWQLCALPDPVERCRNCFEELDQRGNLCQQCRQDPLLPAVRATVFDSESPARLLGLDSCNAMAGFTVLQWIQLEWPLPDAIISMPDPDSLSLGRAFATLLDCPFVRALDSACAYREDRLEEEQELLLIDVSNPLPVLQKAALSLCQSSPKRIYLLTLFPYALSVS
jgi:hypothetical protein